MYAKDQVKMKAVLPGVPEDDEIAVLINHSKITENLEELFLVTSFVNDKTCTVVYAQYDLDSGRCTQFETFSRLDFCIRFLLIP